VELGTGQLTTYNDIGGYLPDHGLIYHLDGPVMGVLAMACWLFTIMKELNDVIDFGNAVWNIQRCRCTVLVETEDGIEVKTFCLLRKLMSSCIVVMRLGIAGILLYVGCLWLATTSSMENLLLNAVALEFVLNVDDILFGAIAPNPSRTLLGSLKPLPRKRWLQWKGVDAMTMFVLVATPTFCTFFYMKALYPMVVTMQSVNSTLCGGHLDFTFAMDPLGMLYVAEAPPFVEPGSTTKTPQHLAVEEAQRRLGKPLGSELMHAIDPTEKGRVLREITVMGMAEAIDFWNPICDDEIVWHTPAVLAYVSFYLGNMTECGRDMLPLCSLSDDLGVGARMLCPVMCGCTNPESIVHSSHASHGCPSSCRYSAPYQDAINVLGCSERTAAELRETDFWPAWAGWVGMTSAADVEREMLERGCGFIDHVSKVSALPSRAFCEGTDRALQMRPMSPVCPLSCGCLLASIPPEGCPGTCLRLRR